MLSWLVVAGKQKDEEIKVVAYLEVTGPRGATRTRRFDQAWSEAERVANEDGLPVLVNLLGFVRKDSPKEEFVIRY